MLQSLGYSTQHARDGRELLSRVQQQTPDLILLDIEMPVLDGIATFRALRKDVRLNHIPVVAMSGRMQEDLAATLEAAGFSAFLAKPFSKAKLGQLLSTLNF